MKKAYFLVVLFLCGLSVGNLFASASAAAAAEEAAADVLGEELRKAVWRGDKAEVEKLIAIGADVNDAQAHTALIYAAMRDEVDIVKLLLKAGADVNARDHNKKTALMHAAAKGNPAIVELLLQKEANLNDQDSQGSTALMSAAQVGSTDMVDLLLQKEGIEVNTTNSDGWTALMQAAATGDPDMVRLLLDAGADKDIQGKLGIRAEHIAQIGERDEITNMIRDYRSGRRIKAAR